MNKADLDEVVRVSALVDQAWTEYQTKLREGNMVASKDAYSRWIEVRNKLDELADKHFEEM